MGAIQTNFKPPRSQLHNRNSSRLDIRPSDGIKGKFTDSNEKTVQVRIYDISVTGAGLLFEKGSEKEAFVGRILTLSLEIPGQSDFEVKATIRWTNAGSNEWIKVGVEFDRTELIAESVATFNFFKVPDFTPIVGALYKPYLFYERSPIKVEEISKDLWQVRIYDPEILAIPGIQYEVYLNSTTGNRKPIIISVIGVTEIQKDSVLVKIRPLSIPKEISEWLAQQLIFGSNISPEALRGLGFGIKNLANGLKFRYIKSQEEYEEVLQLRLKAYSLAGKVSSKKHPKDMIAPLDSISRIIGAYHGGKIVGSVAVSFPNSEEVVLDTERPFRNGYPKKMPSKLQIIEVARLCTDPDYRRGDLMVRILEHIYKALQCGNRKVVVTSTDAKLWPLYKSIGFKKTGMSYDHPYLEGIKHYVITQSSAQADAAKQINPLAWNYAWRDMSKFLNENGTIQRSFGTKIKVSMLSWIGRRLKINLKSKY